MNPSEDCLWSLVYGLHDSQSKDKFIFKITFLLGEKVCSILYESSPKSMIQALSMGVSESGH